MTGKSIQIYLLTGEIDGIKIAQVANRDIQATYIPRNKLKEFHDNGVAIYLLIGTYDDTNEDVIYVGETEEASTRIHQHNKGKTFWNYAVVLSSISKNLNKADVKFLERYIYDAIKNASRYKLENSSVPRDSYVSQVRKAELIDIFETIEFLLGGAFNLYPFKGINKHISINHKQKQIETLKAEIEREETEVFYLYSRGAEGKGYLLGEGKKFVIMKGSKGVYKDEKANRIIEESNNLHKLVANLLEEKIIKEMGGYYYFNVDYICSSPSHASDILSLSSTNGWEEWKNKNNEKLDKLR